MWQIFVEFRSATSEIRGRIKKERKKEEEETLVKYKSADILCRAARHTMSGGLITYILYVTVSDLSWRIGQIIAFDKGMPLFNSLVRDVEPPNSGLRNLA